MSGFSRAVLALGAVWLVACKNDAGPVTVVDPERLYNQMCARCHGLDGKGEPEVAKSLPVKDLTAADVQSKPTEVLERIIMGGQNQMPPFGEVLTPRKIQAVVGHIRKLGKR
ncbi:MAG: c-type cytochrome [Deltaproteobacteria bacterium]|nr:c-type cytochrome [Deltaproteobacteria bacterium]